MQKKHIISLNSLSWINTETGNLNKAGELEDAASTEASGDGAASSMGASSPSPVLPWFGSALHPQTAPNFHASPPVSQLN